MATPSPRPSPTKGAKAAAGAALRRLHFRAGRQRASLPGPRDPVPKVIVMSSSTTSEIANNTSTESANTILTNVTATDGEITEDSLDNEPPQDILISLDSASSSLDGKPARLPPNRILNDKKIQPPKQVQPPPIVEKQPNLIDSEVSLIDTPFVSEQKNQSNEQPKNKEKKVPNTAPPGYHYQKDTKFPFDECGNPAPFTESQSAKERKPSVFDSATNSPKSQAKFIFDIPMPTSPTEHRSPDLLLPDRDVDEKPPKSPKASTSSKAETKFNFDGFPLPSTHKNKRHSTDSRVTQKIKNRKSSVTEMKNMIPQLPDLRIDFFSDSFEGKNKPAETNGRPNSCIIMTEGMNALKQELEGSVVTPSNKNSALLKNGTNNNNENAVNNQTINVVTNPLDNGTGCCNLSCPSYSNNQYRCCACCANNVSQNANRKIPQATIVVQQASLSLDYSNVSTILLKDENDFVSNTSPTSNNSHNKLSVKKKKQKGELLDVNTLTQEEIHDFEMRYGSPHHNRSQSVKAGVGSNRGLLAAPPQRARVASMPSTGVEEQYYRLRHFSITGKGVVNRGDSLKSKRSRSNNSVASSNSSNEHLAPRGSAPPSLASSRESSASAPPTQPYKVLVVGAPGVGKSSLISQFMTSEYLHAYDTSIDDDSGEKSVSVLLAGEESELVFLDHTCGPSPEDLEAPEPHAYCIVYSTSDKSSLRSAEVWLRSLKSHNSHKARILVGNKVDLVRSRAISTEEGKSLAIANDCKFIETSVGINHNVDELLVGLLTQIRLKQDPDRNRRRGASTGRGGGTYSGSAQSTPRKQRGARLSASLKVRGLLGRVWARDSKSKSCENLHVL